MFKAFINKQSLRALYYVIFCFIVVLIFPDFACAGALNDTFNQGGGGYAIVQLLIIASFAALVVYIVSALGYGQVASMIKLVAVFSCISIVIGVVWEAVSSVAGFFGVTL